ncbi:unnamed protein product [Durusdinium trenchii]|uniref:Uncharacterized protein n=2 Tax=Durusdinium trenchii TaxID=1381693 RepID=A0ABP0LPB2_9DINO
MSAGNSGPSAGSPCFFSDRFAMDERRAHAIERLRAAAAQRERNLEHFVKELQHAMKELHVPLADRSFRSKFSRNYRVLFQANPNGYRVEVLESVLDLSAEIWVNRRIHYITGLAMRKGYFLQQRLTELFAALSEDGLRVRQELRQMLQDLDQAWMEFEKHYIMDLIDIEAEARQPLAEAVNLELALREAEEKREANNEEVPPLRRRLALHGWPNVEEAACEDLQRPDGLPRSSMPSISTVSQWFARRSSAHPDTSLGIEQLATSASSASSSACRPSERDGDCTGRLERREKIKDLLAKVCEVNACANYRGRGRPKMSYQVLESAADEFLECQAAGAETHAEALAVREALAKHVLTGFLHLRSYLFDIRGRMLEIDPQLRNNSKLQNCLVAWEDAWELGARFLRPKDVLNALCSLSVRLGHLQRDHESFAQMVDSQEAELFLVLPRLVLLCALASPEVSSPFTAAMLPEQFEERVSSLLGLCFSRGTRRSSEWDELLSKFQEIEKDCSWKQLVRYALKGPSSAEDETLKVFLTELEALTFDLTRRRPEDWNSCSSLLLRCAQAVLDLQTSAGATAAEGATPAAGATSPASSGSDATGARDPKTSKSCDDSTPDTRDGDVSDGWMEDRAWTRE